MCFRRSKRSANPPPLTKGGPGGVAAARAVPALQAGRTRTVSARAPGRRHFLPSPPATFNRTPRANKCGREHFLLSPPASTNSIPREHRTGGGQGSRLASTRLAEHAVTTRSLLWL